MTCVITTNEPQEIKILFKDLAIESPMGFDMLLMTKAGNVSIERKAVPNDLISSVTDGRLARELVAMREESEFQIVLLHGDFLYRRDDTLLSYGRRIWTRKGIRNLIRTLRYYEGAYIEVADSDKELVETVIELQQYFDNLKHLSFRRRPHNEANWLIPSRREKIQFFYQGLPGISAVRAKALEERYPSPIKVYEASIKDLMETVGIGKKLATGIYDFLREGSGAKIQEAASSH